MMDIQLTPRQFNGGKPFGHNTYSAGRDDPNLRLDMGKLTKLIEDSQFLGKCPLQM